MHTEVSLVSEEFDNYQVGLDTDVTFCLKELRAILSFTESVNLPVTASFETCGKYVCQTTAVISENSSVLTNKQFASL